MPCPILNWISSLTEDHVALKEAVHKFSMGVLRPAALELDKLTPEQVVEKNSLYWKCMKQMYELNYHTVLISDAYGGLGLDPLATHIVWEEIAYGSVGFAVSLGCSCFNAFYASMLADDYMIDKFIMPFVNCRDASVMSCWGITEPDHGSDILMSGTDNFHNPKVTQQVKVVKKGSDYILNGQKSAWISNGPVASNISLFVNLDPSMGMAGGGICLVDLNQNGRQPGQAPEQDGPAGASAGRDLLRQRRLPGTGHDHRPGELRAHDGPYPGARQRHHGRLLHRRGPGGLRHGGPVLDRARPGRQAALRAPVGAEEALRHVLQDGNGALLLARRHALQHEHDAAGREVLHRLEGLLHPGGLGSDQ